MVQHLTIGHVDYNESGDDDGVENDGCNGGDIDDCDNVCDDYGYCDGVGVYENGDGGGAGSGDAGVGNECDDQIITVCCC